MLLKDRLCSLLASKNMSYSDLARALGVSRQGVQSWASGRAEPAGKNLYRLAQYLGVTPDWLKTGEHPDAATISSAVALEPDDGLTVDPEEYVYIPEYSLRFSAGPGSEAPSWEEMNDAPMAVYKRSFFQKNHVNPKRCRRATVHGDSMEPVLWDQDKILFEEVPEGSLRIRDGAVYALSYGGDMRVKRLYLKANGDIVLHSDNPKYEDEVISGEELNRIRIYGRVLDKCGSGGL